MVSNTNTKIKISADSDLNMDFVCTWFERESDLNPNKFYITLHNMYENWMLYLNVHFENFDF